MKKYLVLICILVLSVSVVFASNLENIEVSKNSINLTVNGKQISEDNFIYNGRTYVQLRAIGDMLGKDITWDDTTKTAGVNDKDYNPNASFIGYSKEKPSPLGETITCEFQDGYDENFDKKNYKANITILEIKRGDEAEKLIKEANNFNKLSSEDRDWVLAKIKFELIESPDQFNLYSGKFKLISSDGKEYDSVFAVNPEPSLDTKLYKGALQEGYAVFEVDLNDSKPLLVFGKDYDGNGGVWFKAHESR